ncbi:hypothetical protein AWENTII_012973 [Aspergillus wentii]
MAVAVAVGQPNAVPFYDGVPENNLHSVRTTGSLGYCGLSRGSNIIGGAMALFKTTKKHLSGALTAGSFTKETLSPFVQIVTRVLEE